MTPIKTISKSTRFYYNTRYILPIMIGVIVGFALSLLCSPFFYCDTTSFGWTLFDSPNASLAGSNSQIEREQFRKILLEQQRQIDDFEPRINLEGKPKRPSKAVQKLVRPRHTSVELGMRNKLFVGILSTTRMLSPLASYLNESFARCTNKATFFVNNAEMNENLLHKSTPPGLKVVNFNDNRDHLLAFHSIKYAIDNYIEGYDWFFFVTDDSFVRSDKMANKLLDLVNHISITQDLYMGNVVNPSESIYCSISSGIIFSNNVLRKILPNMEWCIKNSYSENVSDNIGRCVLHSSNLPCVNKANGRVATFYHDINFNFDSSVDRLIYSPGFNRSISVSKVKDIETMKKLELLFNAVEMDELDSDIEKISKNILDLACYTPEGCENVVWPLGVAPPYKPTSRHEVIRWDYFNSTHIFLGTDFDSMELLKEHYRDDIDEVIKLSIDYLNKKSSPNRYKFKNLLNGYKQMDPTRGTAYIFDLVLYDSHLGLSVHKRLDVMRPFGNIEIIPMPYVTETSRINLIVPFSIEIDLEHMNAFFNSYQRSITAFKEVNDKINLIFAYFNSSADAFWQQETLTLEMLRARIDQMKRNISNSSKTSPSIGEFQVKLTNLKLYFNDGYRKLSLMEQITHKIPANELVFVGSPCMEIKPELLNRVRLNTIKDVQAFFPIPFIQYLPVVANTSINIDIDINKNVGYFDQLSFEFSSFYNSDFQKSRNQFMFSRLRNMKPPVMNDNSSITEHLEDIYDVFTSNQRIHSLRGTDQALKCRWMLGEECVKVVSGAEQVNRCLKQKETRLGTKSQLAMHLIKNLENLSPSLN